MMQQTVFVIPTPKTLDEYKSSEPYQTLSSIQNEELFNVTIDIVAENTKGISQIYNEKMALYSGWDHINNVVFMHDDVEIHDKFILKKLKKAHEKYDVVGVAGATKQVYSKDKPSLWHMACDNFIWGSGGKSGDGRGFITTPHKNYITQTFFGPTPYPVDFIDGCFMSFNLEAVKNSGVRFDEDFHFHHYDLQMCLNAKLLNLKIGVWPIFIIHYSPGLRSLDDPAFIASDKLFKIKNNI
jgi:GT2 family glycosyltransferase